MNPVEQQTSGSVKADETSGGIAEAVARRAAAEPLCSAELWALRGVAAQATNVGNAFDSARDLAQIMTGRLRKLRGEAASLSLAVASVVSAIEGNIAALESEAAGFARHMAEAEYVRDLCRDALDARGRAAQGHDWLELLCGGPDAGELLVDNLGLAADVRRLEAQLAAKAAQP